jgi:hypothetical protein
VTDLRSSQNPLEAWVQNLPDVRSSQVAAEVWILHIPVTAVVMSQALAEVWIPSTLAAVQPLRVSSQLI